MSRACVFHEDKFTAAAACAEIRRVLDLAKGEPVFKPEEYLTQQQVKSQFTRWRAETEQLGLNRSSRKQGRKRKQSEMAGAGAASDSSVIADAAMAAAGGQKLADADVEEAVVEQEDLELEERILEEVALKHPVSFSGVDL